MKCVLGISIAFWIALGSCRQSSTRDLPVFLPGIYVSQSENEFCRVVDTLVIRKSSLDGDGYQVIRRSSFQRIRQGTRMPVEYQSEQWPAVYEGEGKALRVTDKGKELLYVPAQNKVYNGNTGYEKVE